uniref:Uncharacterized protein n=1 Tax=Aureoumbra lagunensis TaxID=44058 RepID=A0A7S3K4H7_9STRA|mmetsp:Transcript_23851/g.31055  ORF Transcript_23851/g.31055 Transcript_23851/m.31055 type:complete len:416 (-) Transcript_23851:196-1443(-)|eukprot:CAMPEP_0197290948 /NCGR_PEP_ID=MMETSP0890-20130614/10337_1 /TAXON_ID=44058 ORGANISM="Aureoumbra lagunensis, Strain CCMP1510" /NCGR_SAMPLE_ID=MMETSP0890 /ASSEMBLY_ACC=CAM_ASM_000533 /LENGTH=415 /DNA_ID=CAMNT_0042763343 /DNA_START=48 /DNA_END=1295 /DNA_ORIENTATION=-
MKIYIHKGQEGEEGYVKQSIKLPKSWSSKPLSNVLELFVEGYNKKYPDAPISATEWHLERPKGSTLFPDDHVASALTEYCDVYCVSGGVKYRGPPPGTAAALEAKEAEERAAKEAAALEAEAATENSNNKAQWNVKVKCVSLDRGGMDVKSQWKVGDITRVTIEPHATIGMLQNRVGLMVGAHPKHQFIYHPRNGGYEKNEPLSPLDKLKDVMASDLVTLELVIQVPKQQIYIESLSDDEGFIGPEDLEPPIAPPDECQDMNRQIELKAQADEAALAQENEKALDLYSQAIALGAPSSQLLCKRGEIFLALNRPKAASLDATKALEANPDSVKAYKLRAKARRKLGEYELASTDFGQAQRIDFDDSIVDIQAYVTKRAKKIRAIALAEEQQLAEQQQQNQDDNIPTEQNSSSPSP